MNPRHALVVDDDAGCRTVSADMMELLGCSVDRADSGEAALGLAALRWPDLVLMDIRMPGIDGVETLERLRAQPGGAALRVIVMTASVMQSDRRRLASVGFDAQLSKPMTAKSLLKVAKGLIDSMDAPSRKPLGEGGGP